MKSTVRKRNLECMECSLKISPPFLQQEKILEERDSVKDEYRKLRVVESTELRKHQIREERNYF